MSRPGCRLLWGHAAITGFLLGCLLSAALGAENESGPTAAVDRAMAAAERSLQAGERHAAQGHYREALSQGWLLMATLQRLDGRLPEAREALRTASSFAGESPADLQVLASAHLQVGEAARAAEILAGLAGKDPRDVEARRLLARALAADGKPAEAVKRLDEAVAAAPDDPELVFLLATEYLWLKEVETAERLFADVVRQRPIPQTRILTGRSYRDAGEYARARAELQAALRQDPGVRRAHYYLGMVALSDAKTAEPVRVAEAEFREELKLTPDDPLTNDQLGLALLDAARTAEALPLLETAVRGEARSLFVYHLGRCQLALDRAAEAEASLRWALELAGEQGAGEAELEQIHYQLGQALRRLGSSEEASRHLAEAGRLAARRRDSAPEAARPRSTTPAAAPSAEATAIPGIAPQRRLELERRVRGSLTRAYFNLGVLQAQSAGPEPPAERYARAAALFEKAAELDPAFPQVQSSLGVAYFNARQFEKATAPLTRALAAHPQDAGLKRMLAVACVNTQAWEKAVQLLQGDPGRETDVSLEFAYGLALLHSGRAPEAEPVFAGLISRRGDSAELRLLLGQAQVAQQKYDPALESLQRAVQLNPAVEDAHAALGEVLMKQGRADEGLEHLETSVRLAPGNPQLHEQLGQAYQKLGRTAEAEQQFATVRRLVEEGRARRP